MRNVSRVLSVTTLLVFIIAGGIFLTGSKPAESQQPQEITFTAPGFGQDLSPFPGFTPGPDMILAQSSCGNDTCSANQCCCLNTDTGAQCCRPNNGGNCVESCKRGSPC